MGGARLEPDDSAVAPVVGVILMVAITVLLAATVAAFVLGYDEQARGLNPPTVAFSFDYEEAEGGHDELQITHLSGDAVRTENLYVTVDGAACVGGGSPPEPNGRYSAADDFSTVTELSAGMTLTLGGTGPTSCGSGALDLSDATVHVVWDSGTGQSMTFQTWQG